MNWRDRIIDILKVAALITAVWVSPAFSNSYPPTPTQHFYGDADGDGVITPMDLNVLRNLFNGKAFKFDTLQPDNPDQDWNTCDLDSDRSCTPAETNILINYLNGKTVSINDKPWALENVNLPLAGNHANIWIPFTVNLYSTYSGAPSGRPGVSVIAEIDSSSTVGGKLKGRNCDPDPIGGRDQAAPDGAQCALAVTQTDWGIAPGSGNTESGDYGFAIWANGPGSIALKIRIEANESLDIPAVSIHMTIQFGKQLAAGGFHTCAITPSGGVKCWGNNSYGQIGDGTTTDRWTPTDVYGLSSGVVAIATGGNYTIGLENGNPQSAEHSCALTASGGVKCWGANITGQLGDGTTTNRNTPVDVVGLTSGVVAVSAGMHHTCALTVSGGAKCWGSNFIGELGDGTTTERHTPVDVVGLTSGVTAISAGGEYSCALTNAGGVKCWGYNSYGQLGDGTWKERHAPVDVVGLTSGVAAIAAGNQNFYSNFNYPECEHTCALTITGGVKCWGCDTGSDTPVDVYGLTSGISSIAVGGQHSCALTSGGGVKCWGRNKVGAVGDGTITQQNTPVDVIGLSNNVMEISAGNSHNCALLATGEIKCWGYNEYGQLGNGEMGYNLAYVNVSGLSSGVSAISGGSYHSCALTTGGGVKCWGPNFWGELGDGSTERRFTPVDVVGLSSGLTAIASGDGRSCALTAIGGVKCWGDEPGDGSDTRYTPIDVVGCASGEVQIASGGFHTLALSTYEVKAWGSWGGGEWFSTIPSWTPLFGTAISAGYYIDFAVTVSGWVSGRGNDYMGYGLGGLTNLHSGVSSVAAGYGHACALMTTGGVKCSGWNIYGQLGDGTTTNHSNPADVIGLTSGVVAIDAGDYHTCALTSAGGVKCWGSNRYGQLGDGTMTDGLTPVDAFGLTSGVIAVDAGGYHTCAILASGGAVCWGRNIFGALGNGQAGYITSPVDVLW